MNLLVTFGSKAAISTTMVITLVMSIFSLNGFSQTKDSLAIDVVYKPVQSRQEVLFIINGTLMPNLFTGSIDPERIKSLDVSKTDTLVAGRTYSGVIRMTMKDGYAPSFISLTEFKQKYTSLQTGPTVFMLNDQLISGIQDEILIDEKYILKILVNQVADTEEGKYINVVNLLTRSKTNIRKSKEIWLRGNTIEPAANYFDGFRPVRHKEL